MDQKEGEGTPLQCSNCKLWKANAAFADIQQHKNCINTRVCLRCKERRKCKGTCGSLKTVDDFTPTEWEHAAWPSSTSGRCNDCLRSGNWKCKKCKKKIPNIEFTMWMRAHPTSNPDRTTRCNACMVLEQARQREEEGIRRSNMAQVVVLSAERD